MALSKNYERIVAYLGASQEEREKIFPEILALSVEIFHELKEVMQHGTKEDKVKMMAAIKELEAEFTKEAEEAAKASGFDRKLSLEDALQGFSQERQKEILLAKQDIDKTMGQINQLFPSKGGEKKPEGKIKKPHSRKGWIQS